MKKILLILVLILSVQSFYSQGTVFEEKRTIYKREQTFGAVIHTRGWGLTYRYGLYTSGFTRRIFDAELVGVKHPKNTKTFSNPQINSGGYSYGQLNSILVLRLGIGNHRTFISKQSVRGISISSVISGGLSFAYAKPVYIKVSAEFDPDNLEENVDIVRYDPEIHRIDTIVGGTSVFHRFFTGSIIPGAFIKGGLSFESSRQAAKINALEVGAVLDIYYKKIPMMANDFNKMYFFNLYVSLTFGSKKTE
jgi:hypothetical protein